MLAIVHWAWFVEPHLALLWILVRHEERFPRAARQMAAAYDLGCAVYFAVPTAPPWWAAEQGYVAEEMGDGSAEGRGANPPRLRRVMVEVGEKTWGRAWPALYESLGGNPWAAMPSLALRDLAAGGDPALGGRAAGGRCRVGLRADARLRARLPRRALRDRPRRRRRAGGAGAPRRAAGRAAGAPDQRGGAASGAGRQRLTRLPGFGAMGERPGAWSDRDLEVLEEEGREDASPRSSPIRSGLLQTLVVVLLLVAAIYILLPKVVDTQDALDKLGDADAIWIAVALVFNVLAFFSYVALFRGVVGERVLHLEWRESYEITMAGLAATRLFSAGGAGGIVLTYWALRKAGMPRRQTACRMVAFLVLLYTVYMLALVS